MNIAGNSFHGYGYVGAMNAQTGTVENIALESRQQPGTSAQFEPGSSMDSIHKNHGSVHEALSANLKSRFAGGKGSHHFRTVYWPQQQPLDLESGPEDGKHTYRNERYEMIHKFHDNAVYLSPSTARPRRVVVQCTQYVLDNRLDQGDWLRVEPKGHVPLVLRLSEWALRPFEKHGWPLVLYCASRMILVALPVQILLVIPRFTSWEDRHAFGTYTEHRGYHWDWPMYATSQLDMAPSAHAESGQMATLNYTRRSTRPRRLRAKINGVWDVVDATEHVDLQYIFISYAWNQHPSENKFQRLAERVTERLGLTAYWTDRLTLPNETLSEAIVDYNVYTMCDTIRSSRKVAVLLNENTSNAWQGWGRRMWTLPEGLLAPGKTVSMCYENARGDLQMIEVHKVEMTATVWPDREGSDRMESDSARLLAEHYSGSLTLSRLELLKAAINAMLVGSRNDYTGSDLAYALMGLLLHRIERNQHTIFQNLARLSLSNDSDRIIERMLSMLPHHRMTGSEVDHLPLFESLIDRDQFGVLLHHIDPLCEVVGVAAEDETIIVEGCKAMHIRWKDFPQAVVERSYGYKGRLARVSIGVGFWSMIFGIMVVLMYALFQLLLTASMSTNGDAVSTTGLPPTVLPPIVLPPIVRPPIVLPPIVRDIIIAFFSIALALSTTAPLALRQLYGGRVTRSRPLLVGLEGVMALEKLETMIFGNYEHRLTYAPSSTPYITGFRHARERRAMEPKWISDPEEMYSNLPPGHQLFTLVDMGELQISIFSAETPPTVALLCGKEGGMLRAVLCSWRFKDDMLFKETVVRMPTTVYEAAKQKEWLKLCLNSQGVHGRKSAWNKQAAGSATTSEGDGE